MVYKAIMTLFASVKGWLLARKLGASLRGYRAKLRLILGGLC
jgi:hypothetical protein